MRICLIVGNDMTRDSRVDRHARTLASFGHETIVLSHASSSRQSRHERRMGYTITRYFEPLLTDTTHTAQDEISNSIRLRRRPFMTRIINCLNAMSRAFLIVAYRPRLYVAAIRIGANVYHCNDLDTLDVGVAMKIIGRKMVYDSHELYVEQFLPGPLKALLAVFEQLLLRLVDVVITVNPLIASHLQRRYQIRKKVQVVMNCPENIGPSSSEQGASEMVLLLYHGGLYPERGLENLVLASRYFEKHVRLLIRGHGELENRLKELASGLENVTFEESVPMDQVIKAAAKADIGIIAYLPTNLNHIYCSPNKLFDYIQAGLAVVASDLPFLRQVIVGNHIGAVFDPRNPHDIARVVNFVSETDHLNHFKQQVQEIRYRYSWEFERRYLYSAYASLQPSSSDREIE